jgi:hypothetical protein
VECSSAVFHEKNGHGTTIGKRTEAIKFPENAGGGNEEIHEMEETNMMNDTHRVCKTVRQSPRFSVNTENMLY